MTELHIPYEAAVPLAAFLWGKSLSPDYPNGGNVQDIALDLLRKTAPLIVAAELERLAEDVGEPASAQILQRAAELRDTGTQDQIQTFPEGETDEPR